MLLFLKNVQYSEILAAGTTNGRIAMWRMVVQSGSSRGDTKPLWKLQTPTEIGGNVTQLQVMSWPALVHYFCSIHLLPLHVYPSCHANEESLVKLTSTVLWTDTLASSHNLNMYGLGVDRLHWIIFLMIMSQTICSVLFRNFTLISPSVGLQPESAGGKQFKHSSDPVWACDVSPLQPAGGSSAAFPNTAQHHSVPHRSALFSAVWHTCQRGVCY